MQESSGETERSERSFQEEFPSGSASAMECMMALVRAGHLATARLLTFLTPYELSGFAFNALAIIAGADEPLSPHVVSDRMLIPRNTLTGLLDGLERRQLIQRRPHPTNRKMVLLEATPEGRRFISDLLVRLHAAEVEWLSWLPEDDRQTLISLLRRVDQHFRPTVEPQQPSNPQ